MRSDNTLPSKHSEVANKVIISCAVTGSIHTPTMSDALPITPHEIAQQSIDAALAGAAIVHLHARIPETGQPTGDPEVFGQMLPVIKKRCDAVVNITTGGSPRMSVHERLRAAIQFKPEMCSLNMGSMNFAFFRAAKRISKWKYAWEEDHVVNSDDNVFRNSFRDISYILETLSADGAKFEHECYDVGHLYNILHFVETGLIKPPFFIQMAFGILGGIGPHLDNLVFMKRTADRLFGSENYQWSVLAAGRHQMSFVTQAALMGGHVRVGLEDSLLIGHGQLAKSNAQQVAKVVRILDELDRKPATAEEARNLLGLKGREHLAV
jgi:uncharacterized protein (DUF849 family)